MNTVHTKENPVCCHIDSFYLVFIDRQNPGLTQNKSDKAKIYKDIITARLCYLFEEID